MNKEIKYTIIDESRKIYSKIISEVVECSHIPCSDNLVCTYKFRIKCLRPDSISESMDITGYPVLDVPASIPMTEDMVNKWLDEYHYQTDENPYWSSRIVYCVKRTPKLYCVNVASVLKLHTSPVKYKISPFFQGIKHGKMYGKAPYPLANFISNKHYTADEIHTKLHDHGNEIMRYLNENIGEPV